MDVKVHKPRKDPVGAKIHQLHLAVGGEFRKRPGGHNPSPIVHEEGPIRNATEPAQNGRIEQGGTVEDHGTGHSE
jgi:hypothetical protein